MVDRHEQKQLLDAVLNQLRNDNQATESNHPILSESVLASLTSLFPVVLASALHIVDHGKVTKFICQDSRRTFYRVQEDSTAPQDPSYTDRKVERTGSGALYFDIIEDFCFCFFNAKQCLSGGSSLLCKHVLAARLAEAMSLGFEDKLSVKEIADVDFQPLLMSSKNHLNKFQEKSNKAGAH